MEEFFIHLLKSAGLLTVFLFFYNLLLKKDTTFITNRRFLLSGLFTSAILPFIYFTKTVIVRVQPSQLQLTESSFAMSDISIQEPVLSPLEIIAGIYALGVLFMTIRLFLQLYSLIKLIVSGKTSEVNGVKLVETGKQIAPFSFLKFVVYNPGLHSKSELEYILKHEKVHVKQGHTFDVLLANLNLIYQWFNPFSWFYLKSIQQNLEFIADREAVKKAGCKKEYQKALVKISVENFNLALTNNFYQSLIKKRIVMLNKSSTNESTTWKTILVVPALLSFIFLFNIKSVAQVVVEEQKEVSPDVISTDFEISFQIEKATKDEQLEAYSRMLEKYNIQLEFEKVNRNNEGLLTAITSRFIDKNNNSSGSITRQNADGIKGFIIYYSDKEGAGYRPLPENGRSDSHALLRDLGEEPLIIIEGKQHSISQLEGKAVQILGDVTSLNSVNAVKSYGNAAKDGALIISKGQIIEDLATEFKKIDKVDENVVRDYIKFENGKKPMFINVNRNKAANDKKTGYRTAMNPANTNSIITLKNAKNTGNDPLYIINGKVIGRNVTIDTINPANITGVNVLKGYSATAVYGDKAKDGAVIITTRNPSDTSAYRYSFSADSLIYIDASQNVKSKIYALKKGDDANYKVGPNRFYITSRDSTSKPLYIVDGKKMEENFQMNTIGKTGIDSIYVIKGTAATKKYGDKAKGGAIEITTGKQVNMLPSSVGNFEIVKATSTDQGLKAAAAKIKKESGIEVEFKNVKRNRSGVITSIAVSAKHEGETVILTLSETEGVSDIYIGKVNNKIKVTTMP